MTERSSSKMEIQLKRILSYIARGMNYTQHSLSKNMRFILNSMKIHRKTLIWFGVFDRYKFHFPFLRTNNIVHVDDNRVGPLYKHVFPPQLAPRLAFVGLTYSTYIRQLNHVLFFFYLHHLFGKWCLKIFEKTTPYFGK